MTDAAADEARALNQRLELLAAEGPKVELQPPDVSRRARRDGTSIFPPPVFSDRARWSTIAGRGGDLPLRVLAAADPQGVYLHIHGGGWVLGAADLQDGPLCRVADATGLTAVSVEYRLAPEHPFPAGLEDCEDAALWLLDRGLDELAPGGRLAIGGESAGANLAVAALLRLRDRHGVSVRRFEAANLVFGAFDLSRTPSRRLWHRRLIMSTALMDWVERCYLPDVDAEGRRNPDVSRSTPTCPTCRPRSSPSAPRTRCSTTRCSCTRAGPRRGTSRP